jgi:hypothetical protein
MRDNGARQKGSQFAAWARPRQLQGATIAGRDNCRPREMQKQCFACRCAASFTRYPWNVVHFAKSRLGDGFERASSCVVDDL